MRSQLTTIRSGQALKCYSLAVEYCRLGIDLQASGEQGHTGFPPSDHSQTVRVVDPGGGNGGKQVVNYKIQHLR